jgi:hypothetical protein
MNHAIGQTLLSERLVWISLLLPLREKDGMRGSSASQAPLGPFPDPLPQKEAVRFCTNSERMALKKKPEAEPAILAHES